MPNSTLPVLISGAGPVGLSLAVALQHKGIPFELFETLDELSPEARASTFHPPTLEMFAEWGILNQILPLGYKVDCVQFWEHATWELIAEFNYDAIRHDTPYPFRLQCPQSTATRVMKAHLDRVARGHVHMGHSVTRFVDHGLHVSATIETQNGTSLVDGAFLCAADGSRSVIRRQLNLAYEGITYADRFLLVACDIDFKQVYPDLGSVTYLFDPEEWVIILQLPDVTRVVFQLKDHEDEEAAKAHDAVLARIFRFTQKEFPFTIFNVSTYSVHQRVAETFHVGRVLLLGDAAHINNPMGGMGMNSGIHDAHCLAEKLAGIWQGGSLDLLDEYDAARRGYSLNSVRERTHQNYQDMAADEEKVRHERNQRFRAIASDPAKYRAYLLQTSMLEDRIIRNP